MKCWPQNIHNDRLTAARQRNLNKVYDVILEFRQPTSSVKIAMRRWGEDEEEARENVAQVLLRSARFLGPVRLGRGKPARLGGHRLLEQQQRRQLGEQRRHRQPHERQQPFGTDDDDEAIREKHQSGWWACFLLYKKSFQKEFTKRVYKQFTHRILWEEMIFAYLVIEWDIFQEWLFLLLRMKANMKLIELSIRLDWGLYLGKIVILILRNVSKLFQRLRSLKNNL